jgi:hypothetical protein
MKLYSTPDYESPIVEKICLNEELVLVKSGITWAFVEVPKTGSKGWVEKAFLQREPATADNVRNAQTVTRTAEGKAKKDVPRVGTAEKGLLDALQPDAAHAAPPVEEGVAKPKTKADVFDAF